MYGIWRIIKCKTINPIKNQESYIMIFIASVTK